MILQATGGWNHEIVEWVGISVTVIVAFWGFKVNAKRDMQQRHEENRKAQQEAAELQKKTQEQVSENQKKILEELQAERRFLPQHWHNEYKEGMTIDVPLTTDGLVRRPKNGS